MGSRGRVGIVVGSELELLDRECCGKVTEGGKCEIGRRIGNGRCHYLLLLGVGNERFGKGIVGSGLGG